MKHFNINQCWLYNGNIFKKKYKTLFVMKYYLQNWYKKAKKAIQ